MYVIFLDRPDKLKKSSITNNFAFAWKKIKKLYPLHVVTLLVVALAVFAKCLFKGGIDKAFFEQIGYFVANSLLIQSWIPWRDGYYSFNAVSWYLSTSVFSYFAFPWIFRIIQSKNKKRIALLLCVSLGLMVAVSIVLGIGYHFLGWQDAVLKYITYISPVYRLGDFIVGLVAGYFFVSNRKKANSKLYTVIEILIVVILIVQIYLYDGGLFKASYLKFSLFWLPASVLLVYFYACNNGLVSRLLSKCKVLVWLGNISAEAFLIHQICIKAAEYVTKNKVIIALIAFPLTILGTVIWRFIYPKISAKFNKNAKA